MGNLNFSHYAIHNTLVGKIASMKQRFFAYLFHLKKYGPFRAEDQRSAASRGNAFTKHKT
ncbi:hypothetical protein DI53_3774 [Sphingobacterium deserti]|uniref:Uncharacterized protein n=1 Tax=Sphingobacterium deserti TaxID=1229276 RepID=A0A0B8T624_9SPHI|nr:hypothetical protein DI53_3774 [Sphingobacterium deserti]